MTAGPWDREKVAQKVDVLVGKLGNKKAESSVASKAVQLDAYWALLTAGLWAALSAVYLGAQLAVLRVSH